MSNLDKRLRMARQHIFDTKRLPCCAIMGKMEHLTCTTCPVKFTFIQYKEYSNGR